VAHVKSNAETRAAVRALTEGEVGWTLHSACDFESDPGQWGASLINNAELMLACLDAAEPGSVVEVGAYAGDLTALLLGWAEGRGARVFAIDPSPQPELVQLAEDRSGLELIRETSLEAFRHLELPEAVVIDGDHNYYTVSEELRLVGEKSEGAELPLLMLHDVSWPHARRDDYYSPEQIPDDFRLPTTEGGGLFPGVPGVRRGGLPYRWPASKEGGPRNGVLTAVEDFVSAHDGLRLAVVPAFFGFGVVWHADAPWADAVAELLEPFDRNPLLERLEANRVFHLASVHGQMVEAAWARQRVARQEVVLRRLLDSSAFALAERLSSLRIKIGIGKRHAQVSKDEVRRVLGD
jgi:Methyltransferase domain